MSPRTALVVGCGRVGSGYDDPDIGGGHPLSHAGAYAEHPGTELVGGVDPDPSARDRFADRWGARTWPSLERALAEARPALVSVCTPHSDRATTVQTLAAAAVPAVWLEKPMATSSAEAARFAERLRSAGTVVQVNYHRRFDAGHRRVRELIGAEPPVHADLRYSGALETYGTHGIDLFHWLVGRCAVVETSGPPERRIVVLRTPSDQTGCLVRITGAASDLFEFDVHTPSRRFTLSALGEQVSVRAPRPSSLYRHATRYEPEPPTWSDGMGGAMLGGVDSLLAALDDGRAPLCTPADGIAALRVWEAVQAAERSGGRATV